jgi:maltose/moltooligosaccharide transporter
MVAQPKTILSRPRLSFWQIWNMSFGFLGIQFGFALQNANMSRIFPTLGAELEKSPILWLAAPTRGCWYSPVIGYMSDRTWNRLGRRQALLPGRRHPGSLALIVMPSVTALWVAAGLLWILDASINVSMEPFRALVADMLPPEQRTTGFAVQSFFIGTGAVIASALPTVLYNWLDVSNTAPPGRYLPR